MKAVAVTIDRAMLRLAVAELLNGPRRISDFPKDTANALCREGLAEYILRPGGDYVLKITDAGREAAGGEAPADRPAAGR